MSKYWKSEVASVYSGSSSAEFWIESGMKERHVQFSPDATVDLDGLLEWIAEAASLNVALAYVDRIEIFCQSLGFASNRGTNRNDIRPGLRTVGFERRLTIAFEVEADKVTILRVFQGGRNWEDEL
jgi:toxin ParE1/3/4